MAKVLPCSLQPRVGCFDRGVVVVHGIQRALPTQALFRRGHNINSHLLRPGVRPRPTHLRLPLSPRLATIAPAAPGSRGFGRARILVLKPHPSPPRPPAPPPAPPPWELLSAVSAAQATGSRSLGVFTDTGLLRRVSLSVLMSREIDLAVRFVRRAPLGSLPSGPWRWRGDRSVGVGGEAVVAVTGSEGRQAVSRTSRRSVWGGVGSGGRSDLSAVTAGLRATALSLDPPFPPGAVSSFPPRGQPPVFLPALLASLQVVRDRETAGRVQTWQRHVERSGGGTAVTEAG